jgi:hypothetical protein
MSMQRNAGTGDGRLDVLSYGHAHRIVGRFVLDVPPSRGFVVRSMHAERHDPNDMFLNNIYERNFLNEVSERHNLNDRMLQPSPHR